jgi:hypothetical protein
MNTVGAVAALNGIEAFSGALDIEFRIAYVQAPVVDVATHVLAFDVCNRPSILVDTKPDARPVLQVVTFEASDHPARHVRSVASMVVVVIVITVIVVIVFRGRRGCSDQGYRRGGGNGFLAMVVFVAIGMVTSLDDKLSLAVIVNPDAPLIVIPGPSLFAMALGQFPGEVHITVRIDSARLIRMLVALAANRLVGDENG